MTVFLPEILLENPCYKPLSSPLELLRIKKFKKRVRAKGKKALADRQICGYRRADRKKAKAEVATLHILR